MKLKVRSAIVALVLLALITGVVLPGIGTAEGAGAKSFYDKAFSFRTASDKGTALPAGRSDTGGGPYGGNSGGADSAIAASGSSGGGGGGGISFPFSGRGAVEGGSDVPVYTYTYNPFAANDPWWSNPAGPDNGTKDHGNVSPGHNPGPVTPPTKTPPVAVPEFPDLFMPIAGFLGLVGLGFRMSR